ncbi:MAG: RNA methyltransferase [Acidimicrobiia bacterium]|nr:RNA methyltransferase [Acidimicrobiia bacterium]
MVSVTSVRPRLAELRRLARSAAARRAGGVFVVEGATLSAEAAAVDLRVREVYIETSRADEETRRLGDRLAEAGATLVELEAGTLAKVGASVTPQPLLAVVERPAVAATGNSPDDASFVLVAVSVADPGNAGTLLRCAEAAGAGGVIFAGDAADPYGPKAVRASAGSIFRLPPALSEDPVATLDEVRARGLRTVGAAAGRGLPYDRADLTPPLALVVGNESHGLPASLAGHIDEWVHVPLGGQAESLNVGAAAAVLCFEVQRRRRDAPTLDETPADR